VLVNPHDLPRVLASLAAPPGAAATEPADGPALAGEEDVTAILAATPLPDALPTPEDE